MILGAGRAVVKARDGPRPAKSAQRAAPVPAREADFRGIAPARTARPAGTGLDAWSPGCRHDHRARARRVPVARRHALGRAPHAGAELARVHRAHALLRLAPRPALPRSRAREPADRAAPRSARPHGPAGGVDRPAGRLRARVLRRARDHHERSRLHAGRDRPGPADRPRPRDARGTRLPAPVGAVSQDPAHRSGAVEQGAPYLQHPAGGRLLVRTLTELLRDPQATPLHPETPRPAAPSRPAPVVEAPA